jgi:hypothetical protein
MVWFSFDAWLIELRSEVPLESLCRRHRPWCLTSQGQSDFAFKLTRLCRMILSEARKLFLHVFGRTSF